MSWVVAVCALVSTSLRPASAHANELDTDVRACAEAYEQAQVARNAGKLRESEAQLRVCVRDVCPDFVRVDCGQWLSDVRREMPSVILMVTDGSGRELTDVKVSVDGQVVTTSLDGTAFELNPGPHQVTFEHQAQSVTERVDIRQGEKNRVIKVEFVLRADSDNDGIVDAADTCPHEYGEQGNGGCPLSETVDGTESSLSVLEIGAFVAAGVGVAGIVTFGIAGQMATATGRDGIEDCETDATPCTDTQVQTYKDKESSQIIVANLGLVVGGAAAATAVVLYVLSLDEAKARTEPGDVSWTVGAGRDGGWLGVATAF